MSTRALAAAAGLAVLAAAGACAGLGPVAHALAYLLPALLLLLALAARRYPGEGSLLAVIAKRRARSTPHGPAAARVRRPCPRALVPRGGRLLACSLAVRPPPVLRSAATS